MAQNFVQPALCFCNGLGVWGPAEALAVRIQALYEQQRPQQGEIQSGQWKGPLLPSPFHQQPSLGDTFLLPLTSAAYFSAHALAIPTPGHRFWLVLQASLPVTDH